MTVNNGKTNDTKIIRWNFPILGKQYIDILTGFIKTHDTKQITKVCKKEPSFAGFWFENKFIWHHTVHSYIEADYIYLETGAVWVV